MKRCFVFCHGFGFDKSFWDHLIPYFSHELFVCLDLGYFGEENKLQIENKDTVLIGIGHSLGLLKLLALNRKFDYVIGLNGFVNFLGSDKSLHYQRDQELKALQEHFVLNPTLTLKNFYKRCNVPMDTKKLERINKERALNDLCSLSNNFSLPSEIKFLILGSRDDRVVPTSVLYDNFNGYSNVTLQFLGNGSHGLGFLEAPTVYQKIMDFVNDAP